MYRSLNAEKIVLHGGDVGQKDRRAFSGSGLKGVCGELHAIAIKSQERSGWIAKPLKSLRLLVALSITIMIVGLAQSLCGALPSRDNLSNFDLVELFRSRKPA